MAKDKSTDKAAKEIIRLHEIIERQHQKIILLQEEVDNLRHQSIGYDAVLDFLWHKLQER